MRGRAASFSGMAACLIFISTGSAVAQVGPGLVIRPWGDGPHWAETASEVMFIDGGRTEEGNERINTSYWESQGRIRFNRMNPDPLAWVGYHALAIGIDTDAAGLPSGLSDLAAAGAARVGWAGEWGVSVIGGLGIAGDNHFGNADALYGIATVNASRPLSENSALHVGLSYHGNRTFLPDIPLPYALYAHRVSPTVTYQLGLPRSSITWKPSGSVTIQLNYNVPVNLSGEIAYELMEGVSVFGEYRRSMDGFSLDGQGHTRLFYDASRLTTGLRWGRPGLGFGVGVGYAFEQEYSTGFDVRDTDTVARPSDEVLFFLTLRGAF